MGMRRALVLSAFLLACAHKSGGAEPATIRDETVKALISDMQRFKTK